MLDRQAVAAILLKAATLIGLALSLAVNSASRVHAVITNWNIDASGSFTTAANWSFGVPTSQDTAVFNRGPFAYEVSFPVGPFFEPPPNYLVNYLRVHTNDVTFRRGRASDPTDTTPSLTVLNPDVSIVIGETAGDVAILNTTLSSLSGANTSIGRNAGAAGTLNVNSGTFSMSGEINVGRSGTGTLNVAAGGQVESRSAVLGHLETGEGDANVSGVNAVWTNTNGLIIGHVGAGTLNITSGGRVESGYGNLGQNADGEGHAIVSGFNSQWNSPSVDVGLGGTGSLTIREGGLVSGIYGTIGTNPGSSGTVLVSGAGSRWVANAGLVVGDEGAGTLTINNGGAVANAGFTNVGEQSTGTVTVSGSGSRLTTGEFNIGYNGAGMLQIESGGTVSTKDSANIGLNANSTGTVTVSGAGSRLTTHELNVGYNGAGTLRIEAGGAVSTEYLTSIGLPTNSSGTVTVSGADSILSANQIDIGRNGTGSLTIEAGGSASGWARIGSMGVLTVTGTASTFTGTVNMNGVDGLGSLTIANGGRVSGTGSSIYRGTVVVTGAGSSWTINDQGIYSPLSVGGPYLANGSLTIADGASVISNGSDGPFGNISIGGGGEGIVTVTGQNSTWTTNTGIRIGDGSIDGILTIESGGAVSAGGGVFVRDTGRLTGDGTVNANVVNERGVVAPGRNSDAVMGATFGTLTVNGDYAQPNGSLRIRLGGAAFESDYDQLDVSGTVDLQTNASLVLVLANSFVPSVGDQFDILDWGSLSGTFNGIQLPLMPFDREWDTSQLYTSGTLSVVAASPRAPGPGLLSSADTAIAIDLDAVFTGAPPVYWEGSNSPANESAVHAIDQFLNPMFKPGTKYLNFGEERSGIIITNSEGPVDVNFMSLTTANDFPERDPASYELFGTNDPISTTPNSNSNGTEVWTLISSGPLFLPGMPPSGGGDDARFTRTFVRIDSPAAYTSYRLIFPTVKDAAAANSMQIADIQFYTALGAPGDFDDDTDADAADLAIWRSAMDLMNLADADNDYDSDGADFLLWQRYLRSFGPAVPASTAVPEPTTWMLLFVAAAGIRRLRGSSTRSVRQTTKLAVTAVSLLMADMALAASIGINFVDIEDSGVQSGTQDALAPAELAGAPGYQQVNWNNLGRWGAGDSAASLKDSLDTANGVTVTWDSNNTWRTGAGFATSNHKLMHGYLDATGQANVDAPPYQFFSNENKPQAYVTGLRAWLMEQGSPHYDVVVYIDGDLAEGRIGEYWLQGTDFNAGFFALGAELTTHVFVRDSANFSGAFTQAPLTANSLAAAADGNYVVFPGLTSDDFILRTEERFFRAPINGFQIVAAPGNQLVSNWTLGTPSGSGTGIWEVGAHWSSGIVPDVTTEDIAAINGGGTAVINSVIGTPAGSVRLGQGTAAGQSGTLEIRFNGFLNVVDDPIFPADGSVRVGQNVGEGTLRVLPGGTLNCVKLTLGGTVSSSITLGGPNAGTATVNTGAVILGRTTRVIGPNVNFTSSGPGAGITFQDASVFIPEITGATHSALKTTGNATLSGSLQPEFVGVTLMAGQTWTLIDAAAIMGAFTNAASGERVPTIDGLGSFLVHYGLGSPFDPNRVVLSAFRFSADFDEDGDVDGDDLSRWRGDFGVNDESDADNDGDSDGADFLAWQRQFGSLTLAAPPSVPVPEPLTWTLLSVAAAGLRRPRGRSRRNLD